MHICRCVVSWQSMGRCGAWMVSFGWIVLFSPYSTGNILKHYFLFSVNMKVMLPSGNSVSGLLLLPAMGCFMITSDHLHMGCSLSQF